MKNFLLSPLCRSAALTVCAVMFATLGGCAAFVPPTPEAQALERAQKRWDALVAHDWDKAYAFLTPAFRAITPSDRYRNRFIGVPRWTKVTAKSAQCEAQRCTVTIQIEAEYAGRRQFQTLSTEMPETWVQEDGQWYIHQAM